MYFHRGSWISKDGIKSLEDILAVNDAQNWGSTIMDKENQTTSWQQFYPNTDLEYGYGYDCNKFARLAAFQERNRQPAIVEVQISEEIFEKYKEHLKLILTRGKENNITSETSMIVSNAVIVEASSFSYEEFRKYKGELLVSTSILREGSKLLTDLEVSIYPANQTHYEGFVKAYEEGRMQPLYTTKQLISELKPTNIEGRGFFSDNQFRK